MGLIKALNEMLTSHRLRHERRAVPEFFVYFPNGEARKSADIKDISSTGVYLLTEERWLPGSHVLLTLQRRGPFEEDSKKRVTLKSRVVRWGEDGVGLAFALPEDINFELWEAALQSSADHTPSEDILPPFRMAKVLEFLGRLCPHATQDIVLLVRTGLGNMRVANSVQIALEAEAMLASDPNGYKMRADAGTIKRIIADGSWADEDWIKQLWAGLLATSCAVNPKDQLDSDLADRFSQLAPVHMRIFKAACTQAEKFETDDWVVAAKPLICEVEVLQQISGVQSLAKIERDVFHLADLGLLEQSVRSRSLMPPEEINITPSSLGLRLYALCNGHRGLPQNFYGLNG